MRTDVKQKIEEIRKESGAPYLDVSFSRQGKEVFRCVLGENATGRERLRMYSCSKPITAVVAMRLVEEGKLCLDDEVEKYLPEIADCFILSEMGERLPLRRKMTIRHLFTMTAGFTYNVNTQAILDLVRENPNATLKNMIGAFVKSPLSFEPGERFQYSLCHDVLAAVLEAVENKRFSQIVKERVFQPLGMNDSTFENVSSGLAEQYTAKEDGSVAPMKNVNELLPTLAYESGGAGLISTVDDYAKFARALAVGGVGENGVRIIGEQALAVLSREQIGEVSANNQFTCVQGAEYGYGLGVRVRKTATKWGLGAGEYGWDGAAGSYLMIDPNTQSSVVMGMHVRSWPYIFTGKHLEIVKLLYENV